MLHLVICCSTGKKDRHWILGNRVYRDLWGDSLIDCLLEIVEKRLDKILIYYFIFYFILSEIFCIEPC